MAESVSIASTTGSPRSSFHHPYRLEVRGITPISVSLLWSLRPLPLSAIPRSATRTSKPTSYGSASGSGSHSACKPTATSIAAATNPTSALQHRHSPLQRIQAESGSAAGSIGVVGSSSSIVATRSPNRRVTKVSVRNVSPAAKRGGRLARSLVVSRRESGDWPSDDGATAVEEDDDAGEMVYDDAAADKTNDSDHVHTTTPIDDDLITPSETSEDIHHSNAATRIFETGVTVSVNGVPWSQVVVGDSGADEAFIVVYGLHPSREYDLLLTVDDKQSSIAVSTAELEEKQASDALALSSSNAVATATHANSSTLPLDNNSPRSGTTGPSSSSSNPSAVPSHAMPRIKRTHTPPMQDTDSSPLDIGADTSLSSAGPAPLVAAAASAGATAAALQASVRKARKDASRAESALRNEIDAIKRGLERMSDVDHRSKQKVLALQESIRQASSQAKDIDEEATAVESERELWEEREKEKNDELEQVRAEVEESLRVGQSKVKGDSDEIEAVERELQSIAKSAEEKRAAKEKIEREKLTEMEQDLARIHEEIESTLTRSQTGQAASSFYAAGASTGGQQPSSASSQSTLPAYIHGASPLIPAPVPRSRGGRGAARGSGGAVVGGVGGGGGDSSNNGHNNNNNNTATTTTNNNNNNNSTVSSSTGSGGARGGGNSSNISSRRNQNRNVRHHGHHQGQNHGGGSDEYGSVAHLQHFHDHGHQALAGQQHSSSTLNPNNPEFVPSSGAVAAAHSNSPAVARTMMLPSVEQSPPTNARFPSSAYISAESGAPRRASASHLDVSAKAGQSTWRSAGAGTSPAATWTAQHPDGAVGSPSPQMQHDIWSVPASSSPHIRHDNVAGQQSGLVLRTKTSVPFGLNSTLLRGGAYPSFAHSRRGDDLASGYRPDFNAIAGGGGGGGEEEGGGASEHDGMLRVAAGHDAGSGNSAPVSPLQPRMENAHSPKPTS